MKISGFTIARNIAKFNYPALESIKSILPICDEFVVNVGDSEDETLKFIKSMNDPKIKIIENKWDFSQKEKVLSQQTNIALSECSGDWAFYLQGDEVVHEKDLKILFSLMKRNVSNMVDVFRFKWLHFFGSFYRYRIDGGWFQKQDRIIRNNGNIESCGDAYGFRRKDGKPLQRINTSCYVYHYGWVHSPEEMSKRRLNAERIGFANLNDSEKEVNYNYGSLDRFPIYFGTHPETMNSRVDFHKISCDDWRNISRKYWWSPLKMLRTRYKTFKRVKNRID